MKSGRAGELRQMGQGQAFFFVERMLSTVPTLYKAH